MENNERLSGFFPRMYAVDEVIETKNRWSITLRSISEIGICPSCGKGSWRCHSYQERTARDLPIFGKGVLLHILQKKYFCDHSGCATDIFTERNDLVAHYSQFTVRCSEYMLKVSTYVSCETAVKLFSFQGISVCGDTLLNLIKAAGKNYEASPGKIIGVDDWAYRRGKEYGTLICDMETHKIVDVLEGRDHETLEKWLQGHPDIKIVSRDRASSYSSAVRSALPQAVQIADRFHITKNLLEALTDTMKSYIPQKVEVPIEEAESICTESTSPEPPKQLVKKIPKYNKNAKNPN